MVVAQRITVNDICFDIKFKRCGDKFVYYCADIHLVGVGDSLDAAYADFSVRKEEFLVRMESAGLTDSLTIQADRKKQPETLVVFAGRTAITGVVLAACIVLLGWTGLRALDSFAARSADRFILTVQAAAGIVSQTTTQIMVENGKEIKQEKAFRRIENWLHSTADQHNELSPERVAAITGDLDVLVRRIQPFTRSLAPLFQCPAPPPNQRTPSFRPQ